jgi:SAM-dependent methyltransferase
MIAAAREWARETAVSATFQQIPAEQFSTAVPFDAAICLFTTLGQISAVDDNRDLLHTVYRALKPGGQIVVEVLQRETAVAQLKPSDKFGSGERYTAVARQYDPNTSIVSEEFLVVTLEQSQTFFLRYRLFSFPELSSLLTEAGFAITNVFGDYAGTPLAANSPIMLATGRK